jgi:dipeptidyl aminopeptidase/acylaminoacyl peptidase
VAPTTSAPWGRWPSPLSCELAASLALSFSSVRGQGDTLYWIEGRPELDGRRVVVTQMAGGEPEVVSPLGLSLASRLHEYGGGEFALRGAEDTQIVGVRSDQALVAFTPGSKEVSVLVDASEQLARGDLRCSGDVVSFIEEARLDGAVVRSIRALHLGTGECSVLAQGRSFYAGARLSEDQRRLLYVCWDHPHMSWEAAEVWVAELDDDHMARRHRLVDGGPGQAATHPVFLDDGSIALLAEVDGWARPVVHRADGGREVLGARGLEHGGPIWSVGEDLLVEAAGRLFAVASSGGIGVVVEIKGQDSVALELDGTSRITLAALDGALGWLGATPTALGAIGRVSLTGAASETVPLGTKSPLAATQVSRGEPLEAKGSDGRPIFGLLYRPRNDELVGPVGERPPVVVLCHGGPTGQASARFDPLIQLLTTRGFCVVAPNYAGSTGYGAAYRRRLEGEWGIADVADCVQLVAWLGREGLVDADRAAIRGSSAGGFTALLAATTGAFVATVAWYGVADLNTMVATTHDFEAHYVDTLVGPLPEAAALYEVRSPVSRASEITGAVLLLQGLEDRVVPPAQAEAMADALRQAGQEVTLLTFEGEGHGFRRLDTLIAAYRAELSFYERHLCRGLSDAAL